MDVSAIRTLVRDAIDRLPMDHAALRAFHEAFLFRRSVSTTNEGGAGESMALRCALARALTRELIPHPNRVAEPVSQSFKADLLRAVGQLDEFPLRFFGRMASEREPEIGFDDSVSDALLAYSEQARNGLMAEPW